MNNLSKIMHKKVSIKATSIAILGAMTLGLSGCLISPYYAQTFTSKSNNIPITLFTFDKDHPVTIECARASAHGGPFDGDSSYQPVTTIMPASQGMRDANGATVYSASTQQVLPASCWRYYDYPDNFDYITVLRVKQNGSDSNIYTFDKAGLECLGKWNGQAASWTGWLSHSCNKKYLGTTNPIRTVFIRAGI